MFFTGQKVNIGQFSRDNTATLVSDYIKNAERLTKRRWGQILDRCGIVAETEHQVVEGVPSMDKQRRDLYVPSSPAPSEHSDDE
jgi:hypothetical protein